MSESAKPPKPNLELQSSEEASLRQGSEEARMRHALGLHEDGTAYRPAPPQRREHDGRGRRFVRDGEVPVVLLNGHTREPAAAPALPPGRMAEMEAALKAERLARERAEHALREAQAGVERLETKLVHAEMAHAEAVGAERRAREAAEQALSEAEEARQAMATRVAGLERLLAEATARPARSRRTNPSPEAAHAKPLPRHAASKPADAEQEPVKWWLPSYRTKNGKRT